MAGVQLPVLAVPGAGAGAAKAVEARAMMAMVNFMVMVVGCLSESVCK